MTLDKQMLFSNKNIIFCKKCVISNQRPRIIFDEEGICSACRYAEEKKSAINWFGREELLQELCNKHRKQDGSFDVIVPCSGGKDASYVAHLLKHKYGMHPLTITWAPFEYTEIGRKNLDSFINSGFTNLVCTPNKNLHKKLAKTAFLAVGDAFQPFVYGQMSYAFHMACALDIKLVFYGENGEAEYSGDLTTKNWPGMPLKIWSEKYFKGVTVHEMIKYGLDQNILSESDFSPSDLNFYSPPPIEKLQSKNIEFHWMGYYRKWIPQENYYYAQANTAFEANPDGRSEGTYSKYASLDDKLDGFHYYLGFIKFGIGRATSDAAHEIRDGHITREEGVALVKKYDGEFPQKHFKTFLNYLSITEEEFWKVINKYRQEHIWKFENNEWKLRHTVWNEA